MRNDGERLETEIRAVREVLALGEIQEEYPASPPHPHQQESVELLLKRHNLQHLIEVDNDLLRDHLQRLEQDLQHARKGWD